MQCPKPDCMYLHELGDEAASFTKEEMQVKLFLCCLLESRSCSCSSFDVNVEPLIGWETSRV